MARHQLQVLSALDGAKTQLYHFTAIVIAGMGFFTDAYDLFSISVITKLLGRIYYYKPGSPTPGSLPPNVSCAVSGVALCGTLAGQLFFGWLGDKMGRKRVYGVTLLLMVVSSIASGLSFGSTAKGVMATLCFFRFWLGFGIGGDYPLSATIMSEYANKKTRGSFIAAVFAMQGFGILAGGIVGLIVSSAFEAKYPALPYNLDPAGSTVASSDYVWRIILMVGGIPAALTYYWRMKMPETARYTALVARNAKQAAADVATVLQVEIEAEQDKVERMSQEAVNNYGLFSKEFTHRHGLHLVGTAMTWFLLDVVFYSQTLFQKDIFAAVKWLPSASTMSALQELYMISRAQTIIALCGTIPGYWFTVVFIDYMGRLKIQLMGFFFMSVFMFGLAIPYPYWPAHQAGFVVMYAFTFFFANFGPNSTTFVVPAEIFPARLRSTCHGISAATGKAGAIVGAFGFLYAAESPNPKLDDAGYPPGIGVQYALIVLGVVDFFGFMFTFLIPEAKGKSIEEMSGDRERERQSSSSSSSSSLVERCSSIDSCNSRSSPRRRSSRSKQIREFRISGRLQILSFRS
ncbi:inorganic phosphate transporter 1-4-like isoform X2 [Macadamia integrifolia]|uniref:inorganic phosphate transporter 1-4-like isoform X2 n=1 Tax=Macadamia integrifolia TaxID=60698 RepID=UPI001C4FA7C6|nr:inorganic phosphate transporter 1-4-like isoform X2 [Macadamia integrifolia]